MIYLFAQIISQPIKTENTNIIDVTKGDFKSKAFRIPGMITLKSGVLLATTDIRHDSCVDAPAHIDLAVVTSHDNGVTWTDKKQITFLTGKASSMDASVLQNPDTGKIMIIAATFPQNYGYKQSQKGNGFYNYKNERYLTLFDGKETDGQKGKGNMFLAHQNGTIITKDGVKQNITLDADFNLVDENNKIRCNIFLPSCELKLFGTAYLGYMESTDDGKTWSKLRFINNVKQGWMLFFGAGPGRGLYLTTGAHAKRSIFPIYFTNPNKFQSSAVIYSDDNGLTWSLGESPNDRRYPGNTSQNLKTGNQLTESQAVQMPDGQVWLFNRNSGGDGNNQLKISTSFDGGQTWLPEVYSDAAIWESYCQLTAVNYPVLIEGKPAILLANPSYRKGGRKDGRIYVGLINEDGLHPTGQTKYKIEWKYSKLFQPGDYWYSCLSILPNNQIGIAFEKSCNEIVYTSMNMEYITTPAVDQN